MNNIACVYWSFSLNQNGCAAAFTVTASFKDTLHPWTHHSMSEVRISFSRRPSSRSAWDSRLCRAASEPEHIDLFGESVLQPCGPECLSRAAQPELLLMLNICSKHLRRSRRIFPTPLVVSGCSSGNYHVTWPVSAHDSNTTMQMVRQCYPLHILVIVITDLICVRDHWSPTEKSLLLKLIFGERSWRRWIYSFRRNE